MGGRHRRSVHGVIPNVRGSFYGLLLDLQRQLGEETDRSFWEAIKKMYLCYTCHYVGISYIHGLKVVFCQNLYSNLVRMLQVVNIQSQYIRQNRGKTTY